MEWNINLLQFRNQTYTINTTNHKSRTQTAVALFSLVLLLNVPHPFQLVMLKMVYATRSRLFFN